MLKRLAVLTAISMPLSLFSMGSASAAECNLLAGVVTNCTQPSSGSGPSSQPSSPPPSQPAAQPAGTIAEVPGAASRLLELVNAERSSRGMGSLSVRHDVVAIASSHSTDMARRRTIWHNEAYFSSSTKSHLRSAARGENVAMNSNLEDAHRRLMNSEGHRANILNAGFTQVGISVVHDEAGMLYVTENFMTPERGSSAAPAKAKATKAKATKANSRFKAKATRAKATRAKDTRAKATRAKATKVKYRSKARRSVKAAGPRRARSAQRSR